MKKRIVSLVLATVMAFAMLTGCSAKKESWKVTCPWAPSGVAAMVSQKAAAKSTDYSDKITLVAEAIKGDAATVNTWVASTKANDKELVFAGEGLFAITEILDPAKLQFSYEDFVFVENLYSSVFVLSADSSLNIQDLAGLKAYVEAGNTVSVAVNGATGSRGLPGRCPLRRHGCRRSAEADPLPVRRRGCPGCGQGRDQFCRISPVPDRWRPSSRAVSPWSAPLTKTPFSPAPSPELRV